MQRYLFLAVLLLSPVAHAYESTLVETVKTNDGKILNCRYPSDVGRIGYRPGFPILLQEQGEMHLSFSIFGFRCRREDDKSITMELAPMNEPTWVENDGLNLIPLETRAVILNSRGRTLGARVLENKRMQILSLPLDLKRLLTRSDRKSLDQGEPVRVRLQYHHSVKLAYGGLSDRPSDTELGGAYYFYFDLQKDSHGEIQTSLVTVE